MFEKFKAQRDALMKEVNDLIENGDIDGANAKMDEVKALDEKIETAVTAKKNMDALSAAAPAMDITDKGVMDVQTAPEGSVSLEGNAKGGFEDKEKEYENAWAKWAMGTANAEDNAVIKAYNAALTTKTTGVVIPTTLAKGILDDIEKAFPYYADTAKTFVTGAVTYLKDTGSSDAAWYDEATPTADGTQSIGTITLYGCELARSITVSWKLKAMSISEFLPYIRAKLSSKMGQALGYGVFSGRGISPESTWKPEPIGVITELSKSENASQVIELTNPTAEQLIAGFARANAAIEPYYEDGSAYYVNSKTLWNRIAPVCDSTGRPIFTVNSDVQSSIVGYIYGKPVKRDSGVPDDRIVLSNAKDGYIVNVNQQITLGQQDDNKARTTDYNAYGIFDGCPVSAKAHALLKLTYTG